MHPWQAPEPTPWAPPKITECIAGMGGMGDRTAIDNTPSSNSYPPRLQMVQAAGSSPPSHVLDMQVHCRGCKLVATKQLANPPGRELFDTVSNSLQ